jgi:hypothetical protein
MFPNAMGYQRHATFSHPHQMCDIPQTTSGQVLSNKGESLFFPAGTIHVPTALQPAEGKKVCVVVIVPVSDNATLEFVTPAALQLFLKPLQEFMEKSKAVSPYTRMLAEFQQFCAGATSHVEGLQLASKKVAEVGATGAAAAEAAEAAEAEAEAPAAGAIADGAGG